MFVELRFGMRKIRKILGFVTNTCSLRVLYVHLNLT